MEGDDIILLALEKMINYGKTFQTVFIFQLALIQSLSFLNLRKVFMHILYDSNLPDKKDIISEEYFYLSTNLDSICWSNGRACLDMCIVCHHIHKAKIKNSCLFLVMIID